MINIPKEGHRRTWSIAQEIEKFYDELWKLHEEATLTCEDDDVALKVINAIDNAMEEFRMIK